jgi:hypothetical protein
MPIFSYKKITQTAGIIAMGDIGSVRWKFTLEASFTKYSFCMERLKCSSSVWYWGLKKKKNNRRNAYSFLISFLFLIFFFLHC